MLVFFAAAGYVCGGLLASITPEEVSSGKKYLVLFARLLFLILLFLVWGLVGVLGGVLFWYFTKKQYEHIVIAGSSGIILGFYATPVIASVCFLLGLPLGSILPKKERLLSLVLFLLPGSLSYF